MRAIHSVWSDLLYGVRLCRRSPRAALAAAVVMGAGVGLVATMVSILNGVLWRGLPFPDSDRLVAIGHHDKTVWQLSFEDLTVLREGGADVLESVGGQVSLFNIVTAENRSTEGVIGSYVTPELLATLGVPPLLGRLFEESDGAHDAPSAAMVSHGVWQRLFDGKSDVVGKTLIFNREPMTVIGVMPDGFRFPYRSEIWVALRPQAHEVRIAEVMGIAKLKPDVSARRAQLHLTPLLARRDEERDAEFLVRPFTEGLTDPDFRRALQLMSLAVLAVLLISCLNLACLRLSVVWRRDGELGVRKALGASSFRLMRMLLAETLVIGCGGAVIGSLMAMALVPLCDRVLRSGSYLHGSWVDIRLDATALFAAVAASWCAALLGGLLPGVVALRFAQWRMFSTTPRPIGAVGKGLRGLVIAEIGLCFALLIAAGLTIRTATALARFDTGIDTQSLVRGRASLYQAELESESERNRFWTDLRESLLLNPAIQGFGVTAWSSSTGAGSVRLEAGDLVGGDDEILPLADVRLVLPGTLRTLRIGLLHGTDFREETNRSREPAMILSEQLAANLFQEPAVALGQLLTLKRDGERLVQGRVAGVVEDTFDPSETYSQNYARNSVYLNLQDDPPHSASVFVRSTDSLAATSKALRHATAAVEPLAAIYDVDLMTTISSRSRWVERHLRTMFSLFGVVALLLTGFGLNAALAFHVGSRTREFGVRIAVGARSPDIRNHVLRGATQTILPGLLVGLAMAAGLALLLRRFLFGVALMDPTVLTLALSTLGLTSVGASLAPALRASQTDPATLLHTE